jgi:virginiamycin A acetyltransferase
VVGNDVESYGVAVGNPARLIRKRFDDELISLLEKWQWWDLPYEEIAELIPLLHETNFEKVKSEIRSKIR